MRVLITGGAGFIGSHLVDRHVENGDDVVVVDDLSTGSERNLAHHDPARVQLRVGRVEDAEVLDPAFDGIELVYHLAATVGVFEVLRRPLDAMHSNLRATDEIFERAAARGLRTVFASTSEVYGKNDRDALRETDDSIFGATSVSRWLYGISKAADEFLGFAYRRERDLPLTIVRLFNTTGPRQSGAYGMVLPRFVRQARRGEPLTVFGDGSQTRCFTNVHDVVEALMRLARTPEAIGEVVNIGQPTEISILDLAELVRTVCGSASEIEFVAYAQAYGEGFEDMRRRVPDVSKLLALTGYVPRTTISETIAQILAADEQG
jgi:UDP-glucose 4-epimerase